jgi:hypothetical protein
METAAFLGMLGLGYIFSNKQKEERKEGFTGKKLVEANYESIAPGQVVKQPPKTREAKIPLNNTTGDLDIMYTYPYKQSIPSEPKPERKSWYFDYNVPQTGTDSIVKDVMLDNTQYEKTPVLAKEKTQFISPLSGLPMKAEEFTHANMVPFFRGNLKQNMSDTANRNILDNHTGGGFYQQKKQEIGAMFDLQKEPIGVPFGSEIATDFMQERVVAPTNRAGERPFEQIRVGKGLGEGFTSNPSGGYQQANALDYARPRGTDELRTANNPKLTYKGVAIPGSNFVTKPGNIGEVRKHLPDKFYINENGERNFTTTGANLKATERPVQVLRDTTRPETTKEYEGPAKSQDYNATYTVPSTRAPMVKQAGSWGYRNANATSYFDKNVDSDQNDYGKSGIEIRPNERFYTGERGQTLNPKPQSTGKTTMPLQDGPRQTRKDEMLGNPNQAGYVNVGAGGVGKGPAYDPSDVLRTTIKETTIDNDYLGLTVGPLKHTVYDPTDTARTTIKETTIEGDYIGGASGPKKLTVYDPDDIARVTIKETTIDNGYLGIISNKEGQKLPVYDPEDVARITQRNTTDNLDYNRNFARADNPDKQYLPFTDIARVTDKEELSAKSEYYGNSDPNYPKRMVNPYLDGARLTQKAAISANSAYTGGGYAEDKRPLVNPHMDGARKTQKAEISAKSSYTGAAGTANAKAPRSEKAERAMRQYAQKENIAKGRAPAGNIAVFNGEEYMNVKHNKIESDYINDRNPVVNRVLGMPPSDSIIGQQRPRVTLKLDVSKDRMEPVMVAGLETNPYTIPLHKVSTEISNKKVVFDERQSATIKSFTE